MYRAFFTSEKNSFLQVLFGQKALIVYGVLTAIVFAIVFPVREINLNNLLASLTQELIVSEVNREREIAGFTHLSANEKLTQAANMKAKDMAERDYFSHTGPEGERPWVWLDRVGYRYAAAGENLAIDVADLSPLITAWINSPSHKKNIMNKYFTDVGVGVAEGIIDGRKTRVVVMFLGREITPVLATAIAAEETDSQVSPSAQIQAPLSPFENTSPAQTPALEDNKDTPPQEPIYAQVIGDEKLDNATPAVPEPKTGIMNNDFKPASIGLQLFLVDRGPRVIRILLSIFFGSLIALLLFIALAKNRDYKFSVTRVLTITSFIALLWLPEIF